MLVKALLLVTTLGVAAAGLAMVGFATRAYANSPTRGLAALAIGFTLIVGAAISTSISAILTGFEGIRTILFFQTLLTFVGYVVIGYAVYSFRDSPSASTSISESPGR